MDHQRNPTHQDLNSTTKRVLFELLKTKGDPQTSLSLSSQLITDPFSLSKIIQTLKGIGLLAKIDDSHFHFIGTNSAILKFLRFVKKRLRRLESETDHEDSSSKNSSHVPHSYNFRPPKADLQGPALQADFVKQIVMEMLLDVSQLIR